LLVTLPSLEVRVGLPQASVAVAVPSAAPISFADGLQPSVVVVPPVVITGAVLSDVHVTVRGCSECSYSPTGTTITLNITIG
jgi:hypothetical protein